MPRYKKLTEQDKEDIEAGIQKFETAATLKGDLLPSINLGATGCGLCVRYTLTRRRCSKACPVKAFTGKGDCLGTPYYTDNEGRGALNQGMQDYADMTLTKRARFRYRCVEMADFLRALLKNSGKK